MQIYSVSLYAARAALATIATSTSSDTSELLAALVRARARKSLRLVFARPLGAAQLVPPFEEALRRRTGRPANGADAELAGRLVPDGGLRTHDELSLEFHADGATVEGTLRRRGTDGELHTYSTWTVEDAAGWEALQNCYLDSGCGDAGRRQQLVARLPALLAAAPAAAAPAVTAAAPPAAASAPSDGGDPEVTGTSVRSVRLGFGLRLTVYSLSSPRPTRRRPPPPRVRGRRTPD